MITSKTQMPTRGQLQRTLSQRIQKLYKEELGHSPSKVSCQIDDCKLTVIVEDSLTKAEQLLIDNQESASESIQSDVEQIRSDLDNAIRPKFTNLIEEVLGLEVIDLLSDTTLQTGRSGFLVILSESPAVNSHANGGNSHNNGKSD